MRPAGAAWCRVAGMAGIRLSRASRVAVPALAGPGRLFGWCRCAAPPVARPVGGGGPPPAPPRVPVPIAHLRIPDFKRLTPAAPVSSGSIACLNPADIFTHCPIFQASLSKGLRRGPQITRRRDLSGQPKSPWADGAILGRCYRSHRAHGCRRFDGSCRTDRWLGLLV